jgi:hypothetical protein
MSTYLVAAIIIGSVAGICLLLIRINNKNNREAMNKLLKYFSQLGTENDLNFSSQEILKDCVLGLDGVQGKILVVQREDGFFGSFIVNLREVKNCSVKKIFGTINAGDLKKAKLEQYLEKIILHFDLNDNSTAEIVFYKHFENHPMEVIELEQKAKKWDAILSKMQIPSKNTA